MNADKYLVKEIYIVAGKIFGSSKRRVLAAAAGGKLIESYVILHNLGQQVFCKPKNSNHSSINIVYIYLNINWIF